LIVLYIAPSIIKKNSDEIMTAKNTNNEDITVSLKFGQETL
jgi:hypothetical protein